VLNYNKYRAISTTETCN